MSSDTEDFFSACSGSSETNEETIEKDIANLNVHVFKVSVDQESTTSTVRASEQLTPTISANEENAMNEMKEQDLFEVKGHQPSAQATNQRRGGGFQEYNQQQRAAQAAVLNAQRPTPPWNRESASPSPQVSPRVAHPTAHRTVSSSSSQQDVTRPFNQRGSPMEQQQNNSPFLGNQTGRQNEFRDQRNHYVPSPSLRRDQASRNGYNSDQYYSDHQGYDNRQTERMDSRIYEHDGYQSEDISHITRRRDEEDDFEHFSEDEEEKYAELAPVLRQIYSKSRSYSEKMGCIGLQILHTTQKASSNDGYGDMNRLLNHFNNDSHTDGNKLAKLMGYKTFRDMCIYAPEVACLHRWTITEKDGTHIIDNYQPKEVTIDIKKLRQETQTGQEYKARVEDIRNDALQRFINKAMEHEDKPTFKELDYRYRLCHSLNEVNGLKYSVDMGTFRRKHMELYKEEMNTKVYREMFNRKTNHNYEKVIKDRLQMEITIRPNASSNGLVYKLNHPLDVIKQFHDRLKVEIQKHNDKLQAIEDARIARENDGWPTAQKHIQSPNEKTEKVDGESAFGSVFEF
ncbi:hypothetical protein M3Y97_01013100 [Aphelenchoides bicaudatus]|nr:hypothetical protein M3Y97_01013100 [Aphelenchoides bicaudatus]